MLFYGKGRDFMKTAVIYKSKYGAAKKYAEWIAGELECEILEHSKGSASELSKCDLIIYGGGLYAGMISGIGLVTKNPCKNLVVFTHGNDANALPD